MITYYISIIIDIITIILSMAILYDEVDSETPHDTLCFVSFFALLIGIALLIYTVNHKPL